MSSFLYTPFYCEENIWHLCQDARFVGRSRKAVWITGVGELCAVWNQRAALRPGEPIAWDYHVILLVESGGAWEVWDLDTTLPCPSRASDYLEQTFPYAGRIPEEFEPRFRLVDAEEFVATFSSDRSHMLDARGRYRQPLPPWPPIGAGRPSNFARYLDAGDAIAERPMSLGELLARYGGR